MTSKDRSGEVTRDDIEARLRSLQSGVNERVGEARTTLLAVGVAVGAVVLMATFLLGKRKGKRRSTIVEIRRV